MFVSTVLTEQLFQEIPVLQRTEHPVKKMKVHGHIIQNVVLKTERADLGFSVGPVPGGKGPSQCALPKGQDVVTNPQETKQMIDLHSQ